MSLPVVDPPAMRGPRADEAGASADGPTIAGVLLAAGTSSRFGERNKLLAAVESEPVVRRAAETLLASDVDPVVVVLGHEADRVRAALADLNVGFVENSDYRDGQATSVRTGVEAVRERADAALFALGDMPFVVPESVGALLAAYRAGAGDALAAACDGERGNPVLFDARFFDDLAEVSGDTGGRAILLSEGTLVETGDPGVCRDVDEPADLP
jgi:molybdenum cofactor cytidylyltransferase